ncbi:MAG TPA: DNA replication/repair protein RecF [Ruminococcaceae bacterium]|nr:DNA replication/repair protein RecF [Oscillospiraceae bacterium]HBJ25079.1 DNA replication/repair protein RecF [Oscillospiraceae bacterium]
MIITRLYIRNFRNIREAELNFDDRLNVFVGKNAQGKTNLMEAISVCLGGSFRHVRFSQYIPVSDSSAEVFIRLCFRDDDNTGRENIVEYTICNNKPQVKYNGLNVSDAAKLYGVLKYVVFVPEHLNLIKGAPELRRAYLDDVAVMQTQTHLKKLSNYNRGLKQRNNILAFARRDIPAEELSAQLAPWNEVLASEGINVTYGRLKYFVFLQEYAAEIYSRLTEGAEALRMEYSSSIFKTDGINFDDVNALFKEYVAELENNLYTEMKLRYTVAGVHRDDVNFYINDMPARDFASQGQLRSAALALKLSEAEIIRRRNRTCPVVILDDILSELDHIRRGFVINNIDKSQVFITCCNMDDLSALNGGKSWRTENGVFTEV